MPFDRAEALLKQHEIIDELNAMNDRRTELKKLLDEVTRIAEAEPKDITGEIIPIINLDAKWDKIKVKVEKHFVSK